MTRNPQTCQVNYVRFGDLPADWRVHSVRDEMVSFFGNISDVDYFLLAPKQCLSYMYLFIKSVIKMTNHRLAMQRKVPLGGQKGAR